MKDGEPDEESAEPNEWSRVAVKENTKPDEHRAETDMKSGKLKVDGCASVGDNEKVQKSWKQVHGKSGNERTTEPGDGADKEVQQPSTKEERDTVGPETHEQCKLDNFPLLC